MITIIYAGILGLIYVMLSGFVVQGRYQHKISLGDGGNPDMTKRIRMHGNFAEYVPFALLLLFLVDYVQYSPLLVHALGVMLLAGRLFHALAIYRTIFPLRAAGMILTLLMILLSALMLIWHFMAVRLGGF